MARSCFLTIMVLGYAMTVLVALPAEAGDVNVGITIGIAPPPIVLAARPKLVVIPGTAVHYAPGVNANYFVYGGRHFTFHHGSWFIAATFNGPWTFVPVEQIPQPVIGVPVAYYKIPPGHMKKSGGGPPPWAASGKKPKH